jgi:hypothetical protein
MHQVTLRVCGVREVPCMHTRTNVAHITMHIECTGLTSSGLTAG